MELSLGDLARPERHQGPVDITGVAPAALTHYLRQMLLIRLAEERIGDMITAGKIVCPAHLGIGQEAVAVGISAHLRVTDRIFGAHRSHSHYFALGGGAHEIFAEVLGKVTGCSKGMGGSMHLHDGKRGLFGTVPIVAGTVPLAVGAALAARMDGKGDVAVAYFGDGAVEEGVIHESLNLASVFKLPVLFVIENNLFSSHLHVSLRQPSDRMARFGEANCMRSETIDGNDIIRVAQVAGSMIQQARDGQGPALLEAVTYRWRGHVGPREDVDVGVNRQVDLAAWKGCDPVKRLFKAMEAKGLINQSDYNRIVADIENEIEQAWRRAECDPYPHHEALLECVYAP